MSLAKAVLEIARRIDEDLEGTSFDADVHNMVTGYSVALRAAVIASGAEDDGKPVFQKATAEIKKAE